MQEKDKRSFAERLFDDSGREMSQNFDTMNTNMSLAAGTLAAVLTVIGAGELFGSATARSSTSIPALSPVSLLIIVIAAPLVYRFFFRALTAYQNFIRFRLVQAEAGRYLLGRRSWEALVLYWDLYIDGWRSPDSFGSLAWDNLKYGFMWIAIVLLIGLAWAFYSTRGIVPRIVASVILSSGLVWESITTRVHRTKYFQTLSHIETVQLRDIQKMAP